jgi:hypothetical protein
LTTDVLAHWIAHVLRGRFTHDDIPFRASVRCEVAISRGAHYVIRILLTLVWLSILQLARLAAGFLSGLGYSAATRVFPWILMFPVLCTGWLGTRIAQVTRFAPRNHMFYSLGPIS